MYIELHGKKPFGPIPKDMCICHKCDNPSCYEITHLWMGTQQENMADCKNKNRRKSRDRMANPKYNSLQIKELAKLKLSGISTQKISELTGINLSTLNHGLLTAGIRYRPYSSRVTKK